MSDNWPSVTITSFEQVPVASTVTLLRVTGEAPAEIDPGEARPVLLADVDGSPTRYAPIPAPPDMGTIVRVAYSVTEELATTAASFALECADGTVLQLPPPSIGARRTRPRVAAPAEEEDRRSALAPKLAELTEELAEARHETAALRAETHAEIIQLHREAAELAAELAAQRDLARLAETATAAQASGDRSAELEIWSGELERRLADTTTELAEVRADLERSKAELGRLRGADPEPESPVADEPSQVSEPADPAAEPQSEVQADPQSELEADPQSEVDESQSETDEAATAGKAAAKPDTSSR